MNYNKYHNSIQMNIRNLRNDYGLDPEVGDSINDDDRSGDISDEAFEQENGPQQKLKKN